MLPKEDNHKVPQNATRFHNAFFPFIALRYSIKAIAESVSFKCDTQIYFLKNRQINSIKQRINFLRTMNFVVTPITGR